jgi:uncharacterized membrane protein
MRCAQIAFVLFASPIITSAGRLYTFTQIDYPDHYYGIATIPTGINDSGQVVGDFQGPVGTIGFLFSGDTYSELAQFSYTYAISNGGQVLGRTPEGQPGTSQPYNNAPVNVISPPTPTGCCNVLGLNNNGDLVGSWIDPSAPGSSSGYLKTATSFYTIRVPGSVQDGAYSVNAADDVVGVYIDSNGSVHGYLRTGAGNFVNIDVPMTHNTQAFGINDAGDIVGDYPLPPEHAYIPNGFLLSGGVYYNISYPNSLQTSAYAINNNGQIVGDYVDSTGVYGFIATPCTSSARGCISLPLAPEVPEPASSVLIFISILAFSRGRRPTIE